MIGVQRGSFERARILACMLLSLGVMPWADAQQTLPDYTINPGDTLDISLWTGPGKEGKDEQQTTTVVVRPDGKISVQLAGEVVAGNRTVAQITNEITVKLRKYITEPVVTVAVKGLEGCKIYVIGQVSKPGSFVMNPRFTVLQALSLAGGMTPFASVNDVIVLRGAGANQKTLAFRYGDVSKGRNLNQNITLEAGDVVVVP